jgi:hypothetical protein
MPTAIVASVSLMAGNPQLEVPRALTDTGLNPDVAGSYVRVDSNEIRRWVVEAYQNTWPHSGMDPAVQK